MDDHLYDDIKYHYELNPLATNRPLTTKTIQHPLLAQHSDHQEINSIMSTTSQNINSSNPSIISQSSTNPSTKPTLLKTNPLTSKQQPVYTGEEIWKSKMEKMNAELFNLTYGSLVVQLFKDSENWSEVNKLLDKM